jgi:DnaJ-class molecular chaperone
MENFTDYYKTLGVSEHASYEQIKRSFRDLAKEWHPDAQKHEREEATRRFAEISTAYEILSDPNKRRKYDLYRDYSSRFTSFRGNRDRDTNTFTTEREWEDLSRWFQEIYEKHLNRLQRKAHDLLRRIQRGFIGAAIGLSIGLVFRGAAIPLMVLGWIFGYYLTRGTK